MVILLILDMLGFVELFICLCIIIVNLWCKYEILFILSILKIGFMLDIF